MENETLNRFENLVLERHIFEIQVYDYLVTPFLFIPDEFWEPVIVSLNSEQISEFKKLNKPDNCCICTLDFETFCEMTCCKNIMCVECTNQWFLRSVKCPFCIKDLRELS